MTRATFKLVRNRASGELEWAPESESGAQAWLGWLLLAVSTLLFLTVVGFFVVWGFSEVHFTNPADLPDAGAWMREPVQRIMHP